MNNCPTPEELELYAMQEGSVQEFTDIALHLDECPACRQALKESRRACEQLHRPFGIDPGDEFKEKIKRRAHRRWRLIACGEPAGCRSGVCFPGVRRRR